MINFEMSMNVDKVVEGKSAKGNEYKKVKLVGVAGTITTCIFPDNRVYHVIKENERRDVTVVSKLYEGKEKVYVNIKGVTISDVANPFEDGEN